MFFKCGKTNKIMKLITNIQEIERLAEGKDDQNWHFRCFLKGCDMEVGELDEIVHDLYERVSAEIDCQTCGNCCRVIHPVLKNKDVKRLAAHLSMSRSDFKKKYLEEDEDDREMVFRSRPCPFLSANSCSVYSARPDDCRSYPHLHKEDFVFRLNRVVSNCSCCPIVYNVYEFLKDEMYHRKCESCYNDYKYE